MYLEIDLYDGLSSVVYEDEDLKRNLEYIEGCGKYKEGDKKVWVGEEVMFVEL
jgi:hypothetical protein